MQVSGQLNPLVLPLLLFSRSIYVPFSRLLCGSNPMVIFLPVLGEEERLCHQEGGRKVRFACTSLPHSIICDLKLSIPAPGCFKSILFCYREVLTSSMPVSVFRNVTWPLLCSAMMLVVASVGDL